MSMRTLAELAAELGGVVVGDGATVIRGVAGIREAKAGDLTFIANARYDAYLSQTSASAVICSRDAREARVPLLQVDNPYLAFQKAVRLFRPDVHTPLPGVHPTAVVSPAASIGENASIGAHCVVEDGARIGANVVLMPGCYVGVQASVGDDSLLYPRVTVREECVIGARCILHSGVVVGSDGFGFAFDAGRYHKVPQVGIVVVGDDVEIGANTTIDRATTDATRIGDGTKIDNLVQIGHNVILGEYCIICSEVGISGSTKVGSYTTLAGQVGLAGHLKIGSKVTVGAQAGVMHDIPDGETWLGSPAMPTRLTKRIFIGWQRLPELLKRMAELERRLKATETPTNSKS